MDLADTIRDQLNKYRAQPISDSRLLIESAKRKGVMSKISKTQKAVEEAMQSTTQDALESINSLMALTRESRTLPEDQETPGPLDYFLGEDIEAQEQLVDTTGSFFSNVAESTQEINKKDAYEGTIISSDSDDAVEVQPDTDGKDVEIIKFIEKLTMSESSGDPTADRTNEDGRRFAGLLQFGKARLTDYKKATNTKFTQDDFVKDVDLQEKVALWHIKDIDKLIDKTKNKGKYTNRNGLRAVAHLGGRTGMIEFVETQGKYNPADEEGTTLQEFYDKFKD
mgnify:FL=1